jgi:outer membrane protein assembly factor BamA
MSFSLALPIDQQLEENEPCPMSLFAGNDVSITGAKKTDPQLLRDIFNPVSTARDLSQLQESIQIALERLQSMEIIKDASISITPSSSQKGTWNVEIGLQEKRFKINAGTHISPGTNSLAVGTSAIFFNLFGKGESFAMESSVADAQAKVAPISLCFKKPFTNSFGTVALLELYQMPLTKVLTPPLGVHKVIGFWPKVRRNWVSNGKLFSFEIGYHACFKQRLEHKDSTYWTSGISLVAQRSTLDSNVLPTKGSLLKAAIDAMGLGGNHSFLKGSIYAKRHWSLGQTGCIIGISTRFGGILAHRPYNFPLLEQFSLGGPGSLRGYQSFGGCGQGLLLAESGISLAFPLKEWLMPFFFVNGGFIGTRGPFWWSFGTGLGISVGGAGRLEVNLAVPASKNLSELKGKDFFHVGFSLEPL